MNRTEPNRKQPQCPFGRAAAPPGWLKKFKQLESFFPFKAGEGRWRFGARWVDRQKTSNARHHHHLHQAKQKAIKRSWGERRKTYKTNRSARNRRREWLRTWPKGAWFMGAFCSSSSSFPDHHASPPRLFCSRGHVRDGGRELQRVPKKYWEISCVCLWSPFLLYDDGQDPNRVRKELRLKVRPCSHRSSMADHLQQECLSEW